MDTQINRQSDQTPKMWQDEPNKGLFLQTREVNKEKPKFSRVAQGPAAQQNDGGFQQ